MSLILGIDEVGRGAWAGPLAVGAVVFDSRNAPAGLRDSKKLTKIQREKLSREIKQSAISIGVAWVDAKIIDRIGLSRSLKLAAENAFSQIPPDIRENLDQIVVDGTIQLLDDPRAITLVKADDKIASVSAASIVA
jgi:ribonuclease HII